MTTWGPPIITGKNSRSIHRDASELDRRSEDSILISPKSAQHSALLTHENASIIAH